ncbi:MAG: YitT family protein [Oscillospiraceae bacterium]
MKNKSAVWRELKKFCILMLGASILSFGLYNVHAQSNITEGGVLGMTLFLKHWFNISPSYSGFVMDMLCYLLGFKYLGKSFAKYSLVASLTFAASYRVWELFPPLIPDMSEIPVLAAVVGALFVGIGVGLVVRIGGASGGDDALGLTISKKFGIPISRAYFFTDFVVLVLSISYIPISNILCSLITVTLSSFIIGKIHAVGCPVKAAEPQL